MGENGTTGDDIFLTNFSLNSPGSMHTAQTLSFVGKCANEDSANLGTATLTIPAGHQGPLSQTKRIPENSDSS